MITYINKGFHNRLEMHKYRISARGVSSCLVNGCRDSNLWLVRISLSDIL